ncbi:MAG: hypothetical protein KDC39_04575 [Actinobacteria bacterium]|nr:hypothetical protein [Actinomycetota bacterium]
MTTRIFEFDFERRYLPVLALIGVTPATARVEVSDTELYARFGMFAARSPLSNITNVCESGPYKFYKAIGARASFADQGATFGTTTRGGVCMEFAEPIMALDRTGHLMHPGLTLTVKDRPEFAEFMREAAGLTPA